MRIKGHTTRKILKDCGAPRVSDAASKELAKIVNEYAHNIGIRAIETMKFSKRITIMPEDVIYAAKILREKNLDFKDFEYLS